MLFLGKGSFLRGVLAAVVRIHARWARDLVAPRTLRAITPAIVALGLLPWLVATNRLVLTESLGGDAGIFQYTGWCIRHGQKLYRDVGTADGPFIHFLHAIIQVFVGKSDRGFRSAELVIILGGAGAMGALLAPPAGVSPFAVRAHRAAWALLSAAVWLSWYVSLDGAQTTEREVFYSLFGSLGMVMLYASADFAGKTATALLVLGGFFATLQVFGKPTGILYPAMGALCVLFRAPGLEDHKKRLKSALAGAAGSVVTVFLALLLFGSLRGYAFWCFTIPYYGNKFLYGVDPLHILLRDNAKEHWQAMRDLAVIASIGGIAAVGTGVLSRRALGFALTPLLFFGAAVVQRGYFYQFIPVIATAHVLLLIVLSSLWRHRSVASGATAMFALFLIGYQCVQSLGKSPYSWNGESDAWRKTKTPVWAEEERNVGLYIRDHTKPTDRVFAYSAGENAHFILLYAERPPATAFFHSFWLDPIGLLPSSAVKPNPEELAALERLQARIRAEACGQLYAHPPHVIALNLVEHAIQTCPQLEPMLKDDYVPIKRGGYNVYIRTGRGND